jgi:hypothetical protein
VLFRGREPRHAAAFDHCPQCADVTTLAVRKADRGFPCAGGRDLGVRNPADNLQRAGQCCVGNREPIVTGNRPAELLLGTMVGRQCQVHARHIGVARLRR